MNVHSWRFNYLEAEVGSNSKVVRNFHFHRQNTHAMGFALSVGFDGFGATAAQAIVKNEVQCFQVGQLVAINLAEANAREMFFHPLSCNLLRNDLIGSIVVCDQAHIGTIAFIA